MLEATEIRVGNVLRLDNKIMKVLSQEIRGTGKFGKTVHMKLKSLEDGNLHEKSLRAEDRVEDIAVERAKMQFLYKDGDQFVFMNMTNYEQLSLSAKSIGRQEVFLKEGIELEVLFAESKPMSIDFPKLVELKVTSCAPPTKGGGDSNYKEAELENGLKVLVPQFLKEGDAIRVNSETLAYEDRVTLKSMKSAAPVDKEKN